MLEFQHIWGVTKEAKIFFDTKCGNSNIMKTQQMTDQEIIDTIKAIFSQKQKQQGATLETFSSEIGTSPATIHNSIKDKFTSDKTLRKYRQYLNGQPHDILKKIALMPVTEGTHK